MIHPDDNNGDVLRRMEAKGDTLTRPRIIDFNVVFPDQASAEQFAENFREQGYGVSVEDSETEEDFPWDVVVKRNMIPSHREIGDFEALLQGIAGPLGGHNDGWGCITQQG